MSQLSCFLGCKRKFMKCVYVPVDFLNRKRVLLFQDLEEVNFAFILVLNEIKSQFIP